jgi:citrate synthase
MAVMLAAWSALGAYHPEASRVVDDQARRTAVVPRLLGSIASLAGLVIRHRSQLTERAVAPDSPYEDALFAGLFPDRPDEPELVRALDILLVLQADHEQNCSTNAVRAVGSSRVDPYSATAAGIAALYGPLHGGASEAVIHMLHEVGDAARVPAFIEEVKRGDRRLMGFGHRVYKSYDPRAKLIKETADRVFAVTGTNHLLKVAVAIERIALADPYFIGRRLYPNVDFYSGLIYEAMGLPVEGNPVVFAVARMAGWLAQWLEMVGDPEQRITRPRQIYIGPSLRTLAGTGRPA